VDKFEIDSYNQRARATSPNTLKDFRMDIREGQTVRFRYDGGTHPGTSRILVVRSADSTYVNGHDVYADAYRSFLKAKIAGPIEVVAQENEEVIPHTAFLHANYDPSKMDLAAVFGLLHPERTGVRHDAEGGFIVARRTDLPRIELSLTSEGASIVFLNENGARVGFNLEKQLTTPISLPFGLATPLPNDKFSELCGLLSLHAGPAENSGVSTANDGWAKHVEKMRSQGNQFYLSKVDEEVIKSPVPGLAAAYMAQRVACK
jgi:hypothetical protein